MSRKRPAHRPPPATAPAPTESLRPWKVLIGVALVLTIAAYANGIHGAFVYDDAIQIVDNRYIQEGQYFWTALTSDVWAFKGQREEAWSNYWRPTFILWLMLNHRLFGLEPLGWHVTNILLHAGVVVLAAAVLRRLRLRPAVAAPILFIFAVHPVHTESVTWISGSPDMILSLFLLGSYLVYLRARPKPRPPARALALLLYAGATLSKEVSVLFPLFILVSEWALIDEPNVMWRTRLWRSIRTAIPYFLVAGLFLLLRAQVLGMLGRATPWAPSTLSMLLSMPAVLAFYLRQAFWPATLGPAYPLRAVDPQHPGTDDFYIPLAVVLVGAVLAALLWRRGPLYKIGLALFLLPLAPAMNIAAFLPEQIVHDRYLYLPLLGLLMLVFGAAGGVGFNIPHDRKQLLDRTLPVVGLALSFVLLVVTVRYNRAWLSEIALWECGVRVDPDSSHTHAQLGTFYRKAGRLADARKTLERALEINPNVTQVIVDLGVLAKEDRNYEEAERRFRQVLEVFPDFEVAADQLGATYDAMGRLDDAIRVFDDARRNMPYNHVKYTMNIAILHVRRNRPEPALAELESIRDALARETGSELLRCYYFLGELYAGAGRRDDARQMYETFLQRTAGRTGPAIDRYRTNAAARLTELQK